MNKNVRTGLFAVIGLTAATGLLYLYSELTGGFEVPRSASLSNCESRLQIVFEALHRYSDDHSDIPRNEQGEFSPEKLICQDDAKDCILREHAKCSLRSDSGPNWDGLIWCRNFSEFQIKAFVPRRQVIEASPKPFVVMCHDPDCLHPLSGKFYAPILTSHGIIKRLEVDPVEYRDWVDTEFRQGNLAIPPFIAKQIKKQPGEG